MATFEFKLPDIGEGVTEGEIVNWLVKEGDSVDQDQEMVEVMTDKATVTIGAPKAGRISEIRTKVGDVVPVGGVLVVLDLNGGGVSEPRPAAPAAAEPPATPAEPEARKREVRQQESSADAGPAASAVGDIRETLPGMDGAPAAKATPRAPTGEYYSDKPLAAPATRKLARELGVDLRQVRPSGPAGRVTREDVEAFASRSGAAPAPQAAAPAAAPAETRAEPPAPLPPPAPIPAQEAETRVPIRGLRKRIFDNMARSKHTAAHFAYADECDVGSLKELRERCKPHADKAGVKLTFLPFFVKAVVAALKKHPSINCLIDDSTQEMVLRHTYDIGIATATDAGLIVPVLRSADRLSIVEIAREIDRLAAAAREGKSRREDLGGSSFTITSLGKLGGLFSTPVVNYPEVAILGIHEMKRRPVIKGDQITIGDVTVLALSFDHRVVDGHVGAAFTQEVISMIENPDRLLIEMS